MPSLADAADAGVELVDLLGVHAGGRLVEQQQLGLGGERAGKLQAALLAEGEVGGEIVALAGEAGELQRRAEALAIVRAPPQPARAAPGAARCWRSRFSATHRFCQTVSWPNRRMFWKVRAMPCATRTWAASVRTCPRASTTMRPEVGAMQAGDEIDDGALARAVGADQAEDLALGDAAG